MNASPLPSAFLSSGILPPGDFAATIGELHGSMLVRGPTSVDGESTWDAAWRRQLVDNLSIVADQLWRVGIDEIYIDGSFVEAKDHPNDIDGYFVCDPARIRDRSLLKELNAIDPAASWTWDHRARRPYRGYPKLQLPMWHAYRVELYPHYAGLIAGRDDWGNELEFPAFFRKSRATGEQKGIVRLVRAPVREIIR